MGGFKLTNLGTPTADQDSATKKYVDDNSGGSADRIQSGSSSVIVDLNNITHRIGDVIKV